MRVHKSHKKFRKGCTTCKARRVKCDEARPICLTCERRGTPCVYRDSPIACRQTPSSAMESIAGDDILEAGTPPPACRRPNFFSNLMQIEPPESPEIARSVLLSEYFQRAAKGLTVADRSDTRANIYLNIVPSLAPQHTGVSEAIFAIATISLAIAQSRGVSHRAQVSCDGRGVLPWVAPNSASACHLQQAHKYYGQCLKALQEHFISLEHGNTDAVIACSALMIIFELSMAQFDRQGRRRLRSYLNSSLTLGNNQLDCEHLNPKNRPLLDLDWMKHIRGLGSLLPDLASKWLRSASKMRPFFHWPQRESCVSFEHMRSSLQQGTSLTSPQTFLRHPLLPAILEGSQTAFSELRAQMETLCPPESRPRIQQFSLFLEDKRACISALDKLSSVVQYFMASSVEESPQILFRVFSSWVAQSEDTYLDRLAQNNVLALAVYSHFLVYMILFEDFWWLSDLGIGSIQGIMDTVDCYSQATGTVEFDRSWLRDLFLWPKRILIMHRDMGS